MSDSPSAQRGAGRTFPERAKDPTPCSDSGLGTPAKRVYGTGRPDRATGLNLWRRCSSYSHTHPSPVTAFRLPRSGLRSAFLPAPQAWGDPLT